MAKQQTKIYSIFGQIECAAAGALIEAGEATKIEPWDIPESARFNDAGRPALFAVVVPRRNVAKFDKLIADMRA
jgi:hypothetical protein